MMQDWNAYRDALLARVGDYAKQSPDVVRGLTMMDGAAAKTGYLDTKTHELIALAVTVTTRCDGCISVHTQKAAEHGATRGEIAEALGVAIALNAGAALVYSARVLEAHAQLPTA
ncbi:alkylhydroperoxidase [Pseudomonas oryzihabitans]|uniref:Alkylhydroperoxidase n=2 Tax=Pseudomonas oryzihabitans TaxID=47885 RepID=A0A2Z5A7M2_9PSED|nr:alkylhydroperoxidase [Pseudomonas oryzihabitans]